MDDSLLPLKTIALKIGDYISTYHSSMYKFPPLEITGFNGKLIYRGNLERRVEFTLNQEPWWYINGEKYLNENILIPDNVFDFGWHLTRNGFSQNPNMPPTFNRIRKNINLNHYGVRLSYCHDKDEWLYNGSSIKPTEDNACRFIKMAKLAEAIFDEK